MGKDAKRWKRALYNHPVSSVVDYFVINLKGSSDIIDNAPSGHLERKLEIKANGGEEA